LSVWLKRTGNSPALYSSEFENILNNCLLNSNGKVMFINLTILTIIVQVLLTIWQFLSTLVPLPSIFLCQSFLHITSGYFKPESQSCYSSIQNCFMPSHCPLNNLETPNLHSSSSKIHPKQTWGHYVLCSQIGLLDVF
jgi:hypothetical protein